MTDALALGSHSQMEKKSINAEVILATVSNQNPMVGGCTKEYPCILTRGRRKERWKGEIRLIRYSSSCYEAESIGRGTYFYVIAGEHSYGNYICIPNHAVGSELSAYRDLFWNAERLSSLMKKVDAVTIANGL